MKSNNLNTPFLSKISKKKGFKCQLLKTMNSVSNPSCQARQMRILREELSRLSFLSSYTIWNAWHNQGCKFSGNFLNSGNLTENALISGNYVLYKRIGSALFKDIFRKFRLVWLTSLHNAIWEDCPYIKCWSPLQASISFFPFL